MAYDYELCPGYEISKGEVLFSPEQIFRISSEVVAVSSGDYTEENSDILVLYNTIPPEIPIDKVLMFINTIYHGIIQTIKINVKIIEEVKRALIARRVTTFSDGKGT